MVNNPMRLTKPSSIVGVVDLPRIKCPRNMSTTAVVLTVAGLEQTWWKFHTLQLALEEKIDTHTYIYVYIDANILKMNR